MSKTHRLLFTASLVALLTIHVAAQNQHKNQERGFSSNGVYSSNGDVDNINLFNGNLTVTIPIGQKYPVNGQLSYGLTLVYNSNAWTGREVCLNGVDQDTLSTQFLSILPRFTGKYDEFGKRKFSGDPTYIAGLPSDSDPVPNAPGAAAQSCWSVYDPNQSSNAGLGWQITMGKLYRPRENESDERLDYTEKSNWVYMSPDGSEHTFYKTLHEGEPNDAANKIWYTRDGSYLRLNMSPPVNPFNGEMMIEFPNGERHYFIEMPVRLATYENNQLQIKAESEQKLVAIADRFNNKVEIKYIDTDKDGLSNDKWEISDSLNRTQTVYFGKIGTGDYQNVVTRISLEGFDNATGNLAEYGFEYASLVIKRPAPYVPAGVIEGYTEANHDKITAPFLKAVKLPNGSHYAMPINTDDLDHAAYFLPALSDETFLGNYNPGVLRKMILPTGATIEWMYQVPDAELAADQQEGFAYRYGVGSAARRRLRLSAGVRRRIVTLNPGKSTQKVYTWKYDPKAGPYFPDNCKQDSLSTVCGPIDFVNTVTTPEGDYSKHYYSIWPFPYEGLGGELTRGVSEKHSAEYGLPFTKDTRKLDSEPPKTINGANGGKPLFLSQTIYNKNKIKVRSIYVRYETDVIVTSDGYGSSIDSNARIAATRTVYHDDGGRFKETQYRDFDGLGHYRQEDLFGDFGSGDRQLNLTTYNLANGSYNVEPTTNQLTTTYYPFSESSPWVLGTFTAKVASDYSDFRSTTFFSFNNLGQLLAKRTLRNLETPSAIYLLSANDVLVTYAYDSTNNLIRQTFYGSDMKPGLSSGQVQVADLPTHTFSVAGKNYEITYSYRCGDANSTRTTSIPSFSKYKDTDFALTDIIVDCRTGLTAASRESSGGTVNPAGIETTYAYDMMGRLTYVARAKGSHDRIRYSDVKDGSTDGSPKITVEHLEQDGTGKLTGGLLGDESYQYDQLGRMFEEKRKLPTQVYQMRTWAFNGSGWTTAASEWGTTDTNQTRYDGFDPFGRPTDITMPDCHPDCHKISMSYGGDRTVTRNVQVGTRAVAGSPLTVAEESATRVEVYDRQGRLSEVRESSGPSGSAPVATNYTYDVNNKLRTGVTKAIPPGSSTQLTQTRTFKYDNLGNLREENLPELAKRSYEGYDTMGNVGSTFSGKSSLQYMYDAGGRLVNILEWDGTRLRPLKDFVYYAANSASNYGMGKLQLARRHNWVTNPYDKTGNNTTELDVVVREDYVYGGLDGRLSSVMTRLNAEKSTDVLNPEAYTFNQTFTYDQLGNLASQTYPQCTNTTCVQSGTAARPWRVNSFYKNGMLTNVGGGPGTNNTNDTSYSPQITYHSNGALSNIVHGNSIKDKFWPDPDSMQRVAKIDLLNSSDGVIWSSGAYKYDGAGNITKIGNDWFLYDKVNRLVEGTALDSNGKKRRYEYDQFGNMLNLYTYNGVTATGGFNNTPVAYTPNAISATNRVALNYDGAGNAIGLNGQPPLYTYDALNMVKYAPGYTYLYGPDEERVWKVDKGAAPVADKIWVDDALPADAVKYVEGDDQWTWVDSNPPPFSGTSAHQSALVPNKIHQHYFTSQTSTLKPNIGDWLFAYVYIDQSNPPSEVMLQWTEDGATWEHRAYWGQNVINFGANDTEGRRYMGPLPKSGDWVRLEVAAASVGLAGKTVKGMAFTLYSGRATWDRAGMSNPRITDTITLRGPNNEELREYTVTSGNAIGHWAWSKDFIYAGTHLLASETPQGTRHYHLDHLGTPKLITDRLGNVLAGAPFQNFPFGEESSYQAPADTKLPPVDERIRFAGQERDFDYSGLNIYYMHARYYNPEGGKFLSLDPGRDWDIRQPQSWNLYSYARNNPMNATDPTGREMYQALFSMASTIEANSRVQIGEALGTSSFYFGGVSLPLVPTRYLSEASIQEMKQNERYMRYVYDDDGGCNCTIGYGHKLHDGKCTSKDRARYPNGLTEAEADTLLRTVDIPKHEREVRDNVIPLLSQGQFDALVDFSFNGGLAGSQLLGHVNSGYFDVLPTFFPKSKITARGGNGKPSDGLINRRKREVRMWGTP